MDSGAWICEHEPDENLEAALAGADICTMDYDVMLQMYDHPLTDLAVDMFH